MITLIIKNIPNHIGTYSLKDLCRGYGEVLKVKRENGEIKIKMKDSRDAKKAYQAIEGMPLEVVLQQ
jgi:hypothetical protein